MCCLVEELADSATHFRVTSRRLARKAWWQQFRVSCSPVCLHNEVSFLHYSLIQVLSLQMKLIIGGVLVVIIAIIIGKLANSIHSVAIVSHCVEYDYYTTCSHMTNRQCHMTNCYL